MNNLREQIDSMLDCPVVALEIPEWNNITVYIKTLSVADQIEVEKAGQVNDTATIASLVLCDEFGNRIYDDGSTLVKKNPKAIKRILDKALEINNMSVDSVEEAKKN